MLANEIVFSICIIGLAITEIANACCVCIYQDSSQATPSTIIAKQAELITKELPTHSLASPKSRLTN